MIKLKSKTAKYFFITVCLFILSYSCFARDIPIIEPKIIRLIPHSTESFTQGLLVHNNFLYETTGRYGYSKLKKIDMRTGNVLKSINIDGKYFGEGLALLNNKFVNLTWRSGVAFIFSSNDFSQVGELSYVGQGWGLTAMNDYYVMSNGSDTLYFRNKKFDIVKKIGVTISGQWQDKLNELEFAEGMIYANVWYSTKILVIDPYTGNVNKIIECKSLLEKANPKGRGSVLNGIAWDSNTGTFYLTGKNWPYIFEVTL